MSADMDLMQQLDEARAEVARYEQLLDGNVIVTAEAWEQALQAVEAVKRVRELSVWADPKRCGGEPCIRGTRVLVSQVVSLLADYTDDQIVSFHPSVQPWQVALLRALDGEVSDA